MNLNKFVDFVFFSENQPLFSSIVSIGFFNLYFISSLISVKVPSFYWLWALFVVLFLKEKVDDRLGCLFENACIAVNSSQNCFLHSIDGKLCFHFHLSQGLFWFTLWFRYWPIAFLVACCLVCMFVCFSYFSLWSLFVALYFVIGKKKKKCLIQFLFS